MQIKMTWQEMKKKYPNEWLMVVNYTLDKFGSIKEGEVLQHSPDRAGIVLEHPHPYKQVAFRYTGESTFLGFRSHAMGL